MSHVANTTYLEELQERFEDARVEGDEPKAQRLLVELKNNGFETEANFLSKLV